MKGMGWAPNIGAIGVAEYERGKHPNLGGGRELNQQVHTCQKVLCGA